MSYQISTKATNVVVGDRVNKDRRYHSVVDLNVEANDEGATVVSLVFGNGSTIPLKVDDYITVKRSSTATTPPKREVEIKELNEVDEDDTSWIDEAYGETFEEDEVELDEAQDVNN